MFPSACAGGRIAREMIFNSVTGNGLAASAGDFSPSSGAAITVVPEPSIALFGGIGLLGALPSPLNFHGYPPQGGFQVTCTRRI